MERFLLLVLTYSHTASWNVCSENYHFSSSFKFPRITITKCTTAESYGDKGKLVLCSWVHGLTRGVCSLLSLQASCPWWWAEPRLWSTSSSLTGSPRYSRWTTTCRAGTGTPMERFSLEKKVLFCLNFKYICSNIYFKYIRSQNIAKENLIQFAFDKCSCHRNYVVC